MQLSVSPSQDRSSLLKRRWEASLSMRLITVRLMRFAAVGLYRVNNLFLPSGKAKRPSRLELVEDEMDDEPRYYIDAEGEIAAYKRGQ